MPSVWQRTCWRPCMVCWQLPGCLHVSVKAVRCTFQMVMHCVQGDCDSRASRARQKSRHQVCPDRPPQPDCVRLASPLKGRVCKQLDVQLPESTLVSSTSFTSVGRWFHARSSDRQVCTHLDATDTAPGACRCPEECPQDVQELVSACMAPNPSDRPNIEQVISLLLTAVATPPPCARAPPPGPVVVDIDEDSQGHP